MNWIKKKLEKLKAKKRKPLVRKVIAVLEKVKNETLVNPSVFVQNQIDNPDKIPIIIINYNQLYYLKQLVDFLVKRDTKNIVIVDNLSTYPPLLAYYTEISKLPNVTIEFQLENLGHLVFWKNRALFNKYSKGFFVVTDADIVPNVKLQKDYLKSMLNLLFKYNEFTKIGFALAIDDLPDNYSLKENVLKWESKFWELEMAPNVYQAEIDTTFALYWPATDRVVQDLYPSFFSAIRLAGDFTAKHGGWYTNNNNLTNEQLFYIKTANNSNSWKIDETGVLKGDFTNDY
ncbi:glycosyltransferase family A protein [Flavobacterium psychrophilum]|uniref:glycosyltransferase family A protein n=1 Tax=Flavobacterium psychrophilum TaxID=96345 RepID=UPI001D07F19A|nr:glycosyltransferase family A protein [Flavobacterium psychrophilum]EKT3956848.1 glycosyltransferase family 2 protein [Flavobacterium psychrophilum]EKT4508449.1 glycosyltransferase family 2 protein [Flavobacterium psychrophilum]MCB6088586.1 glycosyltransferase family 2 protein [Flavobacterium psychrophilum]